MSTRINRHLDTATLMSFAAGGLAEPAAAVAAAHVSMCAECRDELGDMELIGAALLGTSTPHSGGVNVPARPSEPAPDHRAGSNARFAGDLPLPIARKYGLVLDDVPWKELAPGIWQHRLPLSPGAQGDLYFLKLAPGRKLPAHGHSGSELTLVLSGALTDASGECRLGDVQDLDGESEHQPVGDKDSGCICLIAAEGPPKFKAK